MNRSRIELERGESKPGLLNSIRAKMVIYFSLLFVVVLVILEVADYGGVPFTTFIGYKNQQRLEAFRSLNLVADMKVDRLVGMIEEIHRDIHAYSDNDLVSFNVLQLLDALDGYKADGIENAALWDLLQKDRSYRNLISFLDQIRGTFEMYESIRIARAESGLIFISTDENELGTTTYQEDIFDGALTIDDHNNGDIVYDPLSQQRVMYFSHVIEDQTGQPVAVFVLKVNTDSILDPLFHTGEGLGESGEALLVNQDVIILTSLKHPLPDGSTAKPLEYQIQARPAELAANGQEGIIEVEDYRGTPVLAAYRYIRVTPEWGWGMVVKRDQAELYAPLQLGQNLKMILSITGILALIGLSVVVSGGITRPLRQLSRTAQKVAEGDLDARSPVSSSDEVGVLAGTFNAMVDRVQHWQAELEVQVQVRTSELNKANKDLELEIDERKWAEQVARENERKYSSLFSSMSEGVAIHDIVYDEASEAVDYIIADVNPSYERILDLKREDVVGQKASDLYQTGEPPHLDLYARVAASGEPESFETYFPPMDMHFNISAFSPREGNFAIAFTDISARARAEDALAKKAEELTRSNAELEQFAYVASHDLQEPLRMVASYLQLLERRYKGKLDQDADTFIAFAVDGATRMSNLIHDLLAYSRVGSRGREFELIDCQELFNRVLINYKRVIADSSATVTHDPLPTVLADDILLEQLFQNLIGNAIKFRGDKPLEIHVSVERREGEWLFSVRDNGIGIDPQYAENIFVIFRRLHTSEKYPGTGIGLAISKRILERHGGRIWVESQLDEGAAFYFTLPTTGQMPE